MRLTVDFPEVDGRTHGWTFESGFIRSTWKSRPEQRVAVVYKLDEYCCLFLFNWNS